MLCCVPCAIDRGVSLRAHWMIVTRGAVGYWLYTYTESAFRTSAARTAKPVSIHFGIVVALIVRVPLNGVHGDLFCGSFRGSPPPSLLADCLALPRAIVCLPTNERRRRVYVFVYQPPITKRFGGTIVKSLFVPSAVSPSLSLPGIIFIWYMTDSLAHTYNIKTAHISITKMPIRWQGLLAQRLRRAILCDCDIRSDIICMI